jgi:hypothetical protein
MPGKPRSINTRRPVNRPLRSLFRLPPEYFEVIPIGESLFSPLFQFENALRLAIHKHLTTCYGPDWWNLSLGATLPDIHECSSDHATKAALTSWIGASKRTSILPIHHVTLGHLEEIVKKYRSDCIPQFFQTMDFFLGHMDCIKRVRNLYSHMYPGLQRQDRLTATREIKTLSLHLNTKL